MVARINKNTMCSESDEDSTVIKFIPKLGDELATAAMAEMIPVDGGGDKWQEAAGDGEDDLETLEVERAEGGRKCSETLLGLQVHRFVGQ